MRMRLAIPVLISLFVLPVFAQEVDLDKLDKQVRAGDPKAFRQVLSLAQDASGGHYLEELAEIASHFVRVNPKEFLRAEQDQPLCFGVDFMGEDYVDDEPARARERSLRQNALNSVRDPSLQATKSVCLERLHEG